MQGPSQRSDRRARGRSMKPADKRGAAKADAPRFAAYFRVELCMPCANIASSWLRSDGPKR